MSSCKRQSSNFYVRSRGAKQPWRSHYNAICRDWVAKHKKNTRNGVGFAAAISDAVACSSIAFSNSVAAEVPWRAPRPPTSVCESRCPAFRASTGQKSCQNLDIVQCWKSMQLLMLDCVCVSDWQITINIRYTVVKICCNAWTYRVSYHNTVNIIWSRRANCTRACVLTKLF